jgi:hypothetical protein
MIIIIRDPAMDGELIHVTFVFKLIKESINKKHRELMSGVCPFNKASFI